MGVGSLGKVNNSTRGELAENRTGFSARDVSTFITQGNNLAGSSKGTKIVNPGLNRLVKDDFGNPDATSFLGEFSDASVEQVEALSSAFTSRQSEINQRLRQPGRSQLTGGGNTPAFNTI